jgi:hypothetical protein
MEGGGGGMCHHRARSSHMVRASSAAVVVVVVVVVRVVGCEPLLLETDTACGDGSSGGTMTTEHGECGCGCCGCSNDDGTVVVGMGTVVTWDAAAAAAVMDAYCGEIGDVVVHFVVVVVVVIFGSGGEWGS